MSTPLSYLSTSQDCPGEPSAALQEALAGPAAQLGCLLRMLAAAEAAAGEPHPVAWLPACLRPVMDATERCDFCGNATVALLKCTAKVAVQLPDRHA